MTTIPRPTATETGTDWARLAREIGHTLGPSAAERDRSGEISIEAFESLRRAGATSALVPLEFGGGGASHAEVGQLLRELGRRDPSTAVAFSMHCHLVAATYLDADDLRFPNTDDLASRTLARKTVATGALIETVRLAIEVAGGVGSGAPPSSGSIATSTAQPS